jgi:predicted nuclease of predicted toxin-antitoxin system
LKILLDHNLDRRLKYHLDKYSVATVQEQGWADVLNGELLTLAETHGFDVLITADSNIRNQQNLSNRKLGILVLRALNNRLATHLEMIEKVERALDAISSGEVVDVFHDSLSID